MANQPRPGQLDEYDWPYEPDEQPEMGEYLVNKYAHFGQTDTITKATGYLLPDGRVVQMGRNYRDEDHRHALPSSQAMRRWNWPENVVKQNNESTRTPAMIELMKRAGAVRIIANDREICVHAETAPSLAQKRLVALYVKTAKPTSFVYKILGRQGEIDRPDSLDILAALES